jgi:hypothetical protein
VETSYSGSERRRAPRLAISLAASLRQRSRPAFSVGLVDLSSLGCRLELSSDLEPGAAVWLKLPGLEARYSRVAWCKGGFAGIAFEDPLHEAVIDCLVGMEKEPSRAEIEELRRISARCRALAARASEPSGRGAAADELLALANYCEGGGAPGVEHPA